MHVVSGEGVTTSRGDSQQSSTRAVVRMAIASCDGIMMSWETARLSLPDLVVSLAPRRVVAAETATFFSSCRLG